MSDNTNLLNAILNTIVDHVAAKVEERMKLRLDELEGRIATLELNELDEEKLDARIQEAVQSKYDNFEMDVERQIDDAIRSHVDDEKHNGLEESDIEELIENAFEAHNRDFDHDQLDYIEEMIDSRIKTHACEEAHGETITVAEVLAEIVERLNNAK